MKILKFGGTSVGKPERMHQVRTLITKDNDQKIVVLSALSGTTNALVQMSDALYANDAKKANEVIDTLYAHYVQFISDLFKDKKFEALAKTIIDKHFQEMRELTKIAHTQVEERIYLAQGELLSTQLFQLHLEEEGIASKLIWALDFVSIDEFDEPELEKIEEKLTAVLKADASSPIYITQGYICRNPNGEIDNLKRGGSDYTASLLGAALNCTEVQIWTDIDGMHNNDPRIVNKTFPIHELSFDEAAELAYFGAKILHPATIIPAAKRSIPVKLLNTMEPDAKGTVISTKTGDQLIKAVAAKDGITAIKIKSLRMFLAYGFLRKIFEVFEKYRTSIDMITTSEVAVSLTIDNTTHLEKIIKELEVFGVVEVDTEQTIICIAGQGISEQTESGLKIFTALKEIPVRMVSYGGSKNNVSLLVKSEYKIAALQALNSGLFGL